MWFSDTHTKREPVPFRQRLPVAIQIFALYSITRSFANVNGIDKIFMDITRDSLSETHSNKFTAVFVHIKNHGTQKPVLSSIESYFVHGAFSAVF